MITDEEIANLPIDPPEVGFVEFEKIMRTRLHEAEREVAQDQFGDPSPYQHEYMNKVLAAAIHYDIPSVKDWSLPRSGDNIQQVCRNFMSDVDSFTMQVRLRQGKRVRENSVGLDSHTKAEIHGYISKIKRVIESAELPVEKRDVLYKKLSHFALAVDKSRTDFQSGMGVYIALCSGIGEGFKKLEPARRMIDSIAGLLGKAKDAEDSFQHMLPRSEDYRQIEAPKRKTSSPILDDDTDEIPF